MGGSGGDGWLGKGGGIFADSLALTLMDTGVVDNQARGGFGGRGGDGGSPVGFSLALGGSAGPGGAGGAAQGAGLFASGGLVSVTNSTVSGNLLQGGVAGSGGVGGFASVGGNGGAGGTGGMTQGAGLYLTAGTLNVAASTLDHNKAAGGQGGNGGIGILGLTTGQSGAGGAGGTGGLAQGGGLYTALSVVTLTNATIALNTVRGGTGGDGGIAGYGTGFGFSGAGGPGGLSQGGGVYASSGTLHVLNDTVARNQALDSSGGFGGNGMQAAGSSGQGGGALNAAAVLNARNTIFGENLATQDADFSGAFATAFNNLLEDGTGTNLPPGNPGPNGNIVGTTAQPIDPLLGPLAHNGGPTETMALASSSPAIDAGTATDAPATDQRGEARGNPPDIGAYENEGTDNAVLASALVSTRNAPPADLMAVERRPALLMELPAASLIAEMGGPFALGRSSVVEQGGSRAVAVTARWVGAPRPAGVPVGIVDDFFARASLALAWQQACARW
jgi:hypothetical protein